MAIPIWVKPAEWLQTLKSFEGTVSVAQLPRVVECAVGSEEELAKYQFEVVLKFSEDSERKRWLTGAIQGHVPMTCQRCMDVVDVAVGSEFKLYIAWDEAAAERVADEVEVVVLDEDQRLYLHPVIEDEVLLSIPMVAKHEDCEAVVVFNDNDTPLTPNKPNALADLAKLLK